MSDPARRMASYDDLCKIPENMIGEIIDGELFATPRPSRSHGYATYSLGGKLIPYHFGATGEPGRWIILIEPEIGLGENIIVPDLAGWREERFPEEEEHNWISVAPDWICEVLSPATFRNDKIKKMAIYAKHGIKFYWLLDPLMKTLEAFKLESEQWILIGVYAEDDRVRVEPFQEIEIDLGSLWLENRQRHGFAKDS